MAQSETDQWLLFLRLWRDEEYFECHEVLELLWLAAEGNARWSYQGLIHCAVALHHLQQENWFGMARQWLRAGAKLSHLSPDELDRDCKEIWSQTCLNVEAATGKLSPLECEKLQRLSARLQKQLPFNTQIMPQAGFFL
jgi:predicted metal-dependent hydrolase